MLKAEASGHRNRRRRIAPAAKGDGLRALHCEDQGLRRRYGHHRQLGPGYRAAVESRRRRRAADGLVHLLCRRRRRADRDPADRPLSSRLRDHRRRSELGHTGRARSGRRIFAPRTGVALFYPRAVNEMRMLAKAITDGQGGRRQVDRRSSRRHEVDGVRRRRDRSCARTTIQLFQDMYIASFGPLDPGAKFDEEGPAGDGSRSAWSRARHGAADDLQDGAA